jgi:hypothetical protein|nr:MAG TPA: hypothetical protein [Caudoviricetes sp.]
MSDNIKNLVRLINENPDLPVIPMVGQYIVADYTGEWVADLGIAEALELCIYGERVIFKNDKGIQMLKQELDSETVTEEFIESLVWMKAIVVHIETPTVKLPDNTERIYRKQ